MIVNNYRFPKGTVILHHIMQSSWNQRIQLCNNTVFNRVFWVVMVWAADNSHWDWAWVPKQLKVVYKKLAGEAEAFCQLHDLVQHSRIWFVSFGFGFCSGLCGASCGGFRGRGTGWFGTGRCTTIINAGGWDHDWWVFACCLNLVRNRHGCHLFPKILTGFLCTSCT